MDTGDDNSVSARGEEAEPSEKGKKKKNKK